MADFLHEKRNEIGARLKELKLLVDEYERLQAAAAALANVPTASVAPAAPAPAPGRAATTTPRPRGHRHAAWALQGQRKA